MVIKTVLIIIVINVIVLFVVDLLLDNHLDDDFI